MVIDVTATDAKRHWSYLSEGGASIVLSYAGPSHPTYNGTVLRLRKSPRSNSSSHRSSPIVHGTEPCQELDDPSIAFQDVVTSKLIPSEHLPKLQSVQVNFQWLQGLADVVDVQRPTERKEKDGIDVSRRKAVLATDLVGGSGWAVEIKPKWGFLPSPEHLSPSTRQLKSKHCRFCMHAYLKRSDRGLSATDYCPLDLFSGDETRVRKALRSLWETWVEYGGKANNLRLFDGGKVVDPANAKYLSGLAAKLIGSDEGTMSPADLLPSFVNAVLPMILNNTLVGNLGRLQRTLDSTDIEGLSQLWSRCHPDLPLGHGEPEPILAEWADFVRSYLSGGESTLRYHVLACLLSATFKDCSIILRFQDLNHAGRREDTITVIDLDPKSVSRLSTWEALDRQIVRNFAGITNERLACIDAHRVVSESNLNLTA